ncbi:MULTISPECIES: DUF6507 family protein [unclassified Streptomyces]|uniref:DUF6507 family protein n=1 Tax=unclassified Streptomyces TaxID=2593676 RepID=UPI000C280134|nr:DUF6507 family protein [Streptomyces sp. CB01201]PJM99131.1 hypothetical protein CG740_31365 [Streptomyces sp. CB01201]
MSGWDVSQSGVESVTSLVGVAMDDVAKSVKSYETNMTSAAGSAGTISGAYCGATPIGPIGAALGLFVEKTAGDVLFLGARAAKSVNGARQATAYYVVGDLEMAANSEHTALSAPKIELPKPGNPQDGKK